MRYVISILIVISVCIGCEIEPTVVRPSDRNLVDSVYTRMIKPVRIELDSICATLQNEYYDRAVDSIIEIRISEIESLQNQ